MMPLATTANMIDCLVEAKLLSGPQLAEVKNSLSRVGQPQQLAHALINRGWLTSFQAKYLLNGRGAELVLGPFVILEPLGQGGAGQVFKARHRDRVIALKLLRPELVKDREAVQRFCREIEVGSQVCHPNIAQTVDAGQIGATHYLAIEYVDGPNLERLVQTQGPLPPARAAEYIRQAALGLQHAHQRGLVHRDIKPSNLLVTRAQGEPPVGLLKILDLGLARLLEPAAGSQTANLTLAGGAGVMQGTPDYMAPEQALDFHSADIRADLYSLGCTLYFLLAGKPPFAGCKMLAEKLMKHQQAEPALAELNLPVDLEMVLRKMLAKRPLDRYQTPAELVEAITPFCAGSLSKTADDFTADTKHSGVLRTPEPPARRRKRWPWLVAVAGIVLLLLGVGMLSLPSKPGGAARTEPATELRSVPTVELGWTEIGSFKEKFQGPKPAPGWQYLWNAKGPVGNPANYVPLVWTGQGYNADGNPKLPRGEPAAYVHLGKGGGHPGRGTKQTKSIDYCAIAAYTIQPGDGSGNYYIVPSAVGKGNGLEVIVHVNNLPPALTLDVPRRPESSALDVGLGMLKPGDTIYVAIGPKGDDAQDTFDLDFTINRGKPPIRDVLLEEGFESPEPAWEKRGQATFALDTGQPHGGKKSYRITIDENVPLSYQQIHRIVDDKPVAGDLYQVRFWLRSQNVKAEPGAYAYLEFSDSRNGRVGLIHGRVNVKNGAKGWEPLSITAIAPKDVARVRLGLVLHAVGSAWFDDVEVVRIRRP
jgi:serine/threonine protein kinase